MILKYIICFIFLILRRNYFKSMEVSIDIPQILALMLKRISSSQAFKKFVKKIVQKMNFQKKNILGLTLEKVETIYLSLKSKWETTHYSDQRTRNLENSIWLQNQLRTFIYILCVHLFLKKTSIYELKMEDYSLLHQIFPNKSPEHLQYQIKLLVNNKNNKWSLEESRLFQEIMRQNKESNRWNFIAKQLFARSGKFFFKTPKQCRERWINHIDPTKKKGSWQNKEDFTLLQSVLKKGKKWTLISRELKNTRTQNNVKNRYNSLIKIAKKRFGFQQNQQRLIDLICQTLKSQKQIIQYGNQITSLGQNKNKKQNQQQKTGNINQNFQKQLLINNQEQLTMLSELKESKQVKQKKQPQVQNLSNREDPFKFIFEESEEIQNIAWNNQEYLDKSNRDFFFNDGNFQFQDQDAY